MSGHRAFPLRRSPATSTTAISAMIIIIVIFRQGRREEGTGAAELGRRQHLRRRPRRQDHPQPAELVAPTAAGRWRHRRGGGGGVRVTFPKFARQKKLPPIESWDLKNLERSVNTTRSSQKNVHGDSALGKSLYSTVQTALFHNGTVIVGSQDKIFGFNILFLKHRITSMCYYTATVD